MAPPLDWPAAAGCTRDAKLQARPRPAALPGRLRPYRGCLYLEADDLTTPAGLPRFRLRHALMWRSPMEGAMDR